MKPKTNTALKVLALLRPLSILAFTWRYWRQDNYVGFLKFTSAGTETAQLGNKAKSADDEIYPFFTAEATLLLAQLLTIVKACIDTVESSYPHKMDVGNT